MFDFFRNLTKSAEEKRQERLNAYLDGALTARESRQFEQELAADDALQAELDQLRWVKVSLQELPRVRAPRNFVLDPAIYGQKQPSRAAWNVYPTLRVATVLTAFLFVIALALDVVTPYGALGQPFGATLREQQVAEESLERADDADLYEAEPLEESLNGEDPAAVAPFAVTGEADATSAEEPADGAGESLEVTRIPTEETAEEESVADRLQEAPQPQGTPAPGLAVQVEGEEVVEDAPADEETTALAHPEETLSAGSGVTSLVVPTETPPGAPPDVTTAGELQESPPTFPYLLVLEIVLGVALVALAVTMLLMRRNL